MIPAQQMQATLARPVAVSAIHATDEQYMSLALELALVGRGRVSPNPLVGTVLVRDDQIVGRGGHQQFGGPHAELAALEAAGSSAEGATAYMNLEPCAHTGKTPPCVDALIRAGVARVVVGTRDFNPAVNGKGLARLQAAGIEVTEGVLTDRSLWLNRGFFHWVQTGSPYVILKGARTRDNYVKLALTGADWFTSRAARRKVHQLRSEVDGVMIGRRTAQQDDPRLTVRDVAGTNPRRIVLDTGLNLPDHLNIFTDGAAETWVLTAGQDAETTPWGEQLAIGLAGGRLDLERALETLGGRGITSLLVEGGPALHASFIDAGLAQEIVLFTHPQPSQPAVHARPDLRNVLSIPEDWRVIQEEDLGGDLLIIAQGGPDLVQSHHSKN